MAPDRAVITTVLALTGVLLLPATVGGQQASSIAGVVRDSSGGVLPGVTVEAASPVLIEKIRTVSTDGEGRYNVVDLRPGTYTVTFSLTGFRAVRREGIQLTGGFTATVNADLQVGAVEETITVSGASPIVDVQNTRRQTVVSEDLLNALPSATKAPVNLIVLTPGLAGATDVGGTLGMYRTMGAPQLMTYHGRVGMKITYDGLGILNATADGNVSNIMRALNVQETALESSGITAENGSSGFALNGIPKEGSNRFAVTLTGLFSNESMNAVNLNDSLRARGLTTSEKILKIWDAGLAVGGPLKQDRLWFYVTTQAGQSQNQKPGIFYNKTQGTPLYTPDLTRPGDRYEYSRFVSGRLTWQANAKHKFNGFYDLQDLCRCRHEDYAAPEATFGLHFWPQGTQQITWSSPLTGRLLLQAGQGVAFSHWPGVIPVNSRPEYIGITELSSNFPYNNRPNIGGPLDDFRWAERASISYVTGTHSFKFGTYLEQIVFNSSSRSDANYKVGFDGTTYGHISYRFLNQIPNGITQYADPTTTQARVHEVDLYAQDQWVIKRMTLNYGLRWDHYKGRVPGYSLAAGTYVPARDFQPVDNAPNWNDVNPRLGLAVDLFGNGRTAIKSYLGRYVGKTATTITQAINPSTTSVNSVNRSWNDSLYPVGDKRRANFVPDCDLTSPLANGECGAFQNQNFGRANPNATTYTESVLTGWGVRDSSWDFTVEMQHQFRPGISMTAGYYRSWLANFRATDNLAVGPADYAPYCITAPVDPLLPGGGGYQLCGLYDVAPSKFAQITNQVSPASDYGKQTNHSDFFGVSFDARLRGGMQVGGGVDTGQTTTDRCFVVDSPQELLYCRTVVAFKNQSQVKVHAIYPLPAAFAVSATFQNVPGPQYEANYNVPNSVVAASLGRNLAACGTAVVCSQTASVPLVAPNTYFEDRRTQLDMRVSRNFRFGPRMRLQANLDIYNALNETAITTPNNAYAPPGSVVNTWRLPAPQSVATAGGSGLLVGRLFQISANLNF